MSVLGVHWKDWCWSWNSNTLATWCEEPTHWKRPWCWERLKSGGEGDDRGWDDWMASLNYVMTIMSKDMSLRKLWELVKDREVWRGAVHGVTKNWTWLSNWTTTTNISLNWLWTCKLLPVLEKVYIELIQFSPSLLMTRNNMCRNVGQ